MRDARKCDSERTAREQLRGKSFATKFVQRIHFGLSFSLVWEE
jgi:hypothetical protein